MALAEFFLRNHFKLAMAAFTVSATVGFAITMQTGRPAWDVISCVSVPHGGMSTFCLIAADRRPHNHMQDAGRVRRRLRHNSLCAQHQCGSAEICLELGAVTLEYDLSS